jgi:hypothetical protein
MQRALNRFFTFILALTLVAGGTVTMPGHAGADYAPGETGPTPMPGPDEGGDPDWPDGGKSKSIAPRTGPPRGVSKPVYRPGALERAGLSGKWVWSFRTALSIFQRSFFRF